MPLWEHQIKAVDVLRRYLRDWNTGDGAALITMPTGTGKSAVIAQVLANAPGSSGWKHMMVVTPWLGLAQQIAEDIDARVWMNLGMPRPTKLGRVKIVRSAKSFLDEVSKPATRSTVFVATFAMALEILNQEGVGIDGMAGRFVDFGGVIVDECHYEPAPSWSRAIRAMEIPICLFTATPFRNDNRMFKLDESSKYRYSHIQAQVDAVLRTPVFHTLARQSGPGAYVAELLDKLERHGLLAAGERVLIRCATRADVAAIAGALRDRDKRLIAVHEAFDQNDSAEYLRRRLPAPARRPDVDFYVHQHKLTEGFDDPKIRVLAIYGDFGNDRARVQQIGRILRNPQRRAGETAHVLSVDDQIATTWDRYLLFDQNLGPRAVATDPLDLGSLLQGQPDLFYWDRLFREKFKLEADDAWTKIRFSYSTNVRRVPADFVFEEALLDVERDLIAVDRKVIAQFSPVEDARVFLYLTVRNSPILRDDAFVETELGYAVLHWSDDLLLYSSPDAIVESLREDTFPVDAMKLAALMHENTTVTSISLTNNDLSDWAVRSRSLSARDLAEIAAEVGDSTFGFATAYGHMRVDDKLVQRYTGVKNGRVSDRRAGRGTFAELYAWYGDIKNSLRATTTPSAAIDRYSLPVVPTERPIAAHVLLDVSRDSFRPEEDGAPPLDVEWSGSQVADGSFKVTINGQRVKVGIRWDESTMRYIVKSSSQIPYRAVEAPDLEFWGYINRKQLLRVATADGLVYSNRSFWNQKIRNRGAQGGLLSVLTPVPALGYAVQEKGHTEGRQPWPEDTVFGILDSGLLPGELGIDATILCTDMGAEIADFVGFNSHKVIFAHAKGKSGGKRSKVSASALHDVVSQAMKSLRYMTIGNDDAPDTVYWGSDWSTGKYGPASRLRRGNALASGADYWRAIDSVIQSHAAIREVWLVLGRSLSKAALIAELQKPNPRASALQCHALLTSAWSASQQCGVRLRVFCSE